MGEQAQILQSINSGKRIQISRINYAWKSALIDIPFHKRYFETNGMTITK